MSHIIHYGRGQMALQAATVSVGNTETLLLELKSANNSDAAMMLEHSQLSFLGSFGSLSGGASQVSLRYYVSFDDGATYYQLPVLDSSGNILNQPDLWKSTSPAKFARDIALSSGITAFKVTGQTDAGTASMALGTLLVRNN